jgi:hypothetical protein
VSKEPIVPTVQDIKKPVPRDPMYRLYHTVGIQYPQALTNLFKAVSLTVNYFLPLYYFRIVGITEQASPVEWRVDVQNPVFFAEFYGDILTITPNLNIPRLLTRDYYIHDFFLKYATVSSILLDVQLLFLVKFVGTID